MIDAPSTISKEQLEELNVASTVPTSVEDIEVGVSKVKISKDAAAA